MSIGVGGISRTVRSMTVEPEQALDARRQQLGLDSAQELIQNLQVGLSGTAAGMVGWTSADIEFDLEFYDAPNQRMVAYTVPMFTYGVVIDQMQENDQGFIAPVITAVVTKWIERKGNVITGATVAMSASLPGYTGEDGLNYSGYLHLTFQGYGAIADGNVPDLDIGS